MTDHVEVSRSDGMLTLVLRRVEKKNALTAAMYAVLADALEEARTNPAVRAVLVRAEGEVFCAGNDLGEFAAAAMTKSAPLNVGRFLLALADCTKPVVAAVNGRAVGVGTTMLLHCDHVIVSDDARLSAPFVGLALVPEAASSLLLPARIGHVRAFSMFALGEVVSATDAVAWGLANRVVPGVELRQSAEAVARRFTELPLEALVETKRLVRDAASIHARMAVEGEMFVARLGTAEAREAFTAFAERRAPNFRNVTPSRS